MLIPIIRQKSLYLLGLSLVFLISASINTKEGWAKPRGENSNDQGWPTRRVGGGSRQGCMANGQSQFCRPVIALIPNQQLVTATETPTLSFSIPSLAPERDVQMEFVLYDSQDRLVYETTFAAPVQGTLMTLSLPKTKRFQGLKAGENYRWYLSLIYDPSDRAYDDVVQGWIRYQALENFLASRLQTATPLEQVELYQQAQLWAEAVSILIPLKQNQPKNPEIAQKWQQILNELELELE